MKTIAFALLFACASAEKRNLRSLASAKSCQFSYDCDMTKMQSCCQWNNAAGQAAETGQCGDSCTTSFTHSKKPVTDPEPSPEKDLTINPEPSPEKDLTINPEPSPEKDTNPNQDTGCWCENLDTGKTAPSKCQSYDMCSSVIDCGNSGYVCGGSKKPVTDPEPSPEKDTSPTKYNCLDHWSISFSQYQTDCEADAKCEFSGGQCVLSSVSCLDHWSISFSQYQKDCEADAKCEFSGGVCGTINGSDTSKCAIKCGVGTVRIDDQCVGVAATCKGLWGDTPAHYRPQHACQCNSRCGEFGNCCLDYADINDTSTGTGKFCHSKGCPNYYDSGWSCQCNDLCQKYGNCCDDAKTCASPTPAGASPTSPPTVSPTSPTSTPTNAPTFQMM